MEINTLISTFLSGEATTQQKAELEAWRHADEAHEKEFQNFCESWNLVHTDMNFVYPDKEKVWDKIMSSITQIKPVKMYSRSILYRAVGIAATVAILIGFSIPLLLNAEPENKLVSFKAPPGQKAQVCLPDGTNVFLNSGSELIYSTEYSRTNRSVRLNGQAFFDVTKDKQHPFDVAVGNIKVVVHGTTFDVNGYKDSPNISVALLTGHISIISASTGKLLVDMKPNQKSIIPLSNNDKCILKTCNAEEEAIWRLGKLKIEDERITDIIRKIERWYGVKITLNNANTTKRYWMTIKTETLKETIEIINRMTPISYSINGEEVNITCK